MRRASMWVLAGALAATAGVVVLSGFLAGAAPRSRVASHKVSLSSSDQAAWESTWRRINAERLSAGSNELRRIGREQALLAYDRTMAPGTLLREWRGALRRLSLVNLDGAGEAVVGEIALSDTVDATPHLVRFAAFRATLSQRQTTALDSLGVGDCVSFTAELLSAELGRRAPKAPVRPHRNIISLFLKTVAIHFAGRVRHKDGGLLAGEAPPATSAHLFADPDDPYALVMNVRLATIEKFVPLLHQLRLEEAQHIAIRQFLPVPGMGDDAPFDPLIVSWDSLRSLHQSYRQRLFELPEKEQERFPTPGLVANADSLRTVLNELDGVAHRLIAQHDALVGARQDTGREGHTP